MQIKREIQTWGERAYDFTTGMVSTLEDGLMRMAQDFRNWGDHVKGILKEVYYEAIRIAFIRPAAEGMAGLFSGVGSAVVGGLGGLFGGTGAGAGINPPAGTQTWMAQNYEALSGFYGYAEGGIAWTPQLAMVAEKEPELIVPFSKLGGPSPLRGGDDRLERIMSQAVLLLERIAAREDLLVIERQELGAQVQRDRRRRGGLSQVLRGRD